MKKTTFLGLILILSLLAVKATASELVESFRAVSPAVGALYSRNMGGDLTFKCTVTAVDKQNGSTVFLTAYHCVSKDVAHLITLDGRQFYAARVWKIPHDKLDAQKYPRRYGEPETDMALFLVDKALDITTIPLGDDKGIEAGTQILVVGFPLGISKINYEGIIAGRLEQPGSDQDGYLMLQSFGAPGSSGSAVINGETNTVIGVLVSGQQANSGLPVIFATPISYEHYLIDAEK